MYFLSMTSPTLVEKVKDVSSGKPHSLYSISMKSHYKNSQAMKKSEIVEKLSKTSLEEGSAKDLQLVNKNKSKK